MCLKDETLSVEVLSLTPVETRICSQLCLKMSVLEMKLECAIHLRGTQTSTSCHRSIKNMQYHRHFSCMSINWHIIYLIYPLTYLSKKISETPCIFIFDFCHWVAAFCQISFIFNKSFKIQNYLYALFGSKNMIYPFYFLLK